MTTVTQLKYPRRLLRVYDKLYPYIYITCVLLLSFHAVTVGGEPCKFDVDEPCICTTNSFQLNLKSFMDARKGMDLEISGESNQFTYYVQPCNRKLSQQLLNCVGVNPNLVSCQVNQISQQAYGLGVLDMFDATQDQDHFILTNSFPAADINRTLHLTIKCSDKEEQFTYDGNSQVQTLITYKFTLRTRHPCVGENKKGLSPGSIMVIIFFVLLIVYIVGGLLFQKFVRKAQGLEVIPNYVFWKDFPFLIKDGVVFTFSCCKGSSGYDKI